MVDKLDKLYKALDSTSEAMTEFANDGILNGYDEKPCPYMSDVS